MSKQYTPSADNFEATDAVVNESQIMLTEVTPDCRDRIFNSLIRLLSPSDAQWAILIERDWSPTAKIFLQYCAIATLVRLVSLFCVFPILKKHSAKSYSA